MHKIDSANAVVGKFVAGDPSRSQPPTYLTADWCNALQEELVAVVEGAGLALDKANNAQLRAAIAKMIANASSSGGNASELIQQHVDESDPHTQYLLKTNASKNLMGWVQSKRDFVNGTLFKTDINYNAQNGEPFVLEIKGNSYGVKVPFDTQIQGYIYNNTIINLGGISKGCHIESLVAFNLDGKLCFWMPRMAYWQGCLARIYVPSIKSQYPSWHDAYENLIVSIEDVVKPTEISKEVDFTPHILKSFHSGNLGSFFASVSPVVEFKIGASSAAQFKNFDELVTYLDARYLYRHTPIAVTVEDGIYQSNAITINGYIIKFTGNLNNPENCVIKFDIPDSNGIAHGLHVIRSTVELSGFKIQGVTTASCWTMTGVALTQAKFFAKFGTLIIDGAVRGYSNNQSLGDIQGIQIYNFKEAAAYTCSGGTTHYHLAKMKSNNATAPFTTPIPAHLKGAGKPYPSNATVVTAFGAMAVDGGNAWGVNMDIDDVYYAAYTQSNGYQHISGLNSLNCGYGITTQNTSSVYAHDIGAFTYGENNEAICRVLNINAKYHGVFSNTNSFVLLDKSDINSDYAGVTVSDNSTIKALNSKITAVAPTIVSGNSLLRITGELIGKGTGTSLHGMQIIENSTCIDDGVNPLKISNCNTAITTDDGSYFKMTDFNRLAFVNCTYRTSQEAAGLGLCHVEHNRGSYIRFVGL